LQAEATTFWHSLILCGCILLVSLASYVILRVAAQGAKRINPIALRIGTRIMGLLLAAIAVQFMLNAIKALKGELFG
ncbi:MAG TPA: MarC family protein, partial [Candidatus Binatia bacterium]|nr:MarC family protein [Candidatus Binatia bacterium]